MINNIWFKIIAGKINKIPEFYTIFARKIPDYIIRQRDQGQAEAKTSRPRLRPRPKFWPRGHFGLEDLTSLQITRCGDMAIQKWDISRGVHLAPSFWGKGEVVDRGSSIVPLERAIVVSYALPTVTIAPQFAIEYLRRSIQYGVGHFGSKF